MPDRFLREGLLRSAAINDLADATAFFYVRLLLLVDDFGCYDGRATIISTMAYPARERERVPDIETMLLELHRGDLIVRYSNAAKPYLALTQWRCGLRSRRKFPAPPVDVDLYDGNTAEPRGPYNREVIWNNPTGSDDVSILLDVSGRPTVPQPPEWRPLSHCTPVPRKHRAYAPKPADQSTVTGDQSLQNGAQGLDTRPRTLVKVMDKVVPIVLPSPPVEGVAGGTGPVDQGPDIKDATPTPATIEFENGQWKGLAEAQRLRWQGMFASLSIPDQLERAAAWLEANTAERDAIRIRGEGFAAFIVRWLLREARDTGRAKGGTDS